MTNATEHNIVDQTNEKKMNEYERRREERIKENFERMKKLGILDLSLKLKTASKPKPTRKYNNGSPSSTPQRVSPMSRHVGPVRRSSRYIFEFDPFGFDTFVDVGWDYFRFLRVKM